MKTQENSAEKLLNIIEEKDRRIAELEQQVQWFMSQIRLAKHKQAIWRIKRKDRRNSVVHIQRGRIKFRHDHSGT